MLARSEEKIEVRRRREKEAEKETECQSARKRREGREGEEGRPKCRLKNGRVFARATKLNGGKKSTENKTRRDTVIVRELAGDIPV